MAEVVAPGAEPKTPFYKSPWLWAFVLGAITLTALGPMQKAMRTAPPSLFKLEPWSLTDHRGQAFGSEQLAGKVWVADYFFTRCPSICLELTKTMKKVQESLGPQGDAVHLVSISVDPDADSPEVLDAYMKKHGADPATWTFLTGEGEAIRDLAIRQMKLFVGKKEPVAGQAGLYDISHMGKLVLVDQRGEIRAFFDTDPGSLGALRNAARLLIERGPDA